MAERKSDQMANLAQGIGEGIPTVDWHGRVRRRYFKFTAPTGDAAVNDTVELVRVESGYRIFGGILVTAGMGTGATASIGDASTPAKYGSGLAIATATEVQFGNTKALNWGEKIGAPFVLLATVTGAAWTAGTVLEGYIEYMHD